MPRLAAIEAACQEMMEGRLDAHIVVDALQGGAGTSTNMNVNEVLANRALQLLGRPLGDYADRQPARRHQPASVDQRHLSDRAEGGGHPAAAAAGARGGRACWRRSSARRQEFAHVVKVGRTQLQDAVLITLGREMGAYAEAFARDRWRIYKCEERLRVVNLGGTAIGTGLCRPAAIHLPRRRAPARNHRPGAGAGGKPGRVHAERRRLRRGQRHSEGLRDEPAEDLRRTCACCRPGRTRDSARSACRRARPAPPSCPARSIPVIPEAVSQAAMVVMANDQAIAQACAMGNLELNAFLPLVADALLGSLDLLRNACRIFREHCVAGIEADEARCRAHVEGATATLTALVEPLGYEKAQEIARPGPRGRKSSPRGRPGRGTACLPKNSTSSSRPRASPGSDRPSPEEQS